MKGNKDSNVVGAGAGGGAEAGAKREAPVPARCLGWTGGLWQEDMKKPGGVLLAMLSAKAAELGHSQAEMCEALGYTGGYISQLRGGARKTVHIQDEFVTACAAYLGVPRITVQVASRRMSPLDMYADPHEALRCVPKAIKWIQKDEKYGPLVPPELPDLSPQMQLFVVFLYEAATNTKLLPGYEDPEELTRQMEVFIEQHLALLAKAEREKANRLQQLTGKEPLEA
ncbi:helix-turn-helix domain-containing protein [Paraburkholderia sp. UCT31]|uniref:helix-turn-helix domain-containing protein n=1 Tax=Paraburkholderia sp. UCT31 TaxID=2615209 RepID=UPI00165582BC|nr:helix-turn-helix domain-containing protein [Paraburkholderia sp. UCT31]MBC8738540.1 helix-turn-helix domain-containing protein [Paraburkholderia sp. UCT31]